MITKIFYSLVLFPGIQYGKDIYGYNLDSLEEGVSGEIILYFRKDDVYTQIRFVHIDFLEDEVPQFRMNSWWLFGDNKAVVTQVYASIRDHEIPDFHFFKPKEFYSAIPFWSVLTVTSKCNLFCNYCFNDYDYPLKDRNLRKGLSLEEYQKIVDILYISGTRDIIITGWEPFSSPFLFELLLYIQQKGIFIRINTNGTLLSDAVLERLNTQFSLNLMVSMHEFNNEDYFKINEIGAKNIQWLSWLKSFEKKFEQKVEQLRKLPSYRNLSLDFLTILTPKNILFLEKIYEFVMWNFTIENWHFFRLYSTGTTKWISRNMINLAIHKIYKLNQKYHTGYKIVDSVPFCVTKDVWIASAVIDGELSPHHNVKTIITTDGYIQIMSAFDTNLWSIFEKDLGDVWRWDFVQKMLHQGFLPKECSDCVYKESCRGWSRMDAHIFHGDYAAFDPLGDINYKITQ